MQLATNIQARQVLETLTQAQDRLATTLSQAVGAGRVEGTFVKHSWLRQQGLWGGGFRLESANTEYFNSASLNVSQVQYEKEACKALSSATALSVIVHPGISRAPSLHLHISWTYFKDGRHGWRLMADLNPAIFDATQQSRFRACLQEALGVHAECAEKNGEAYFYIPVAKRHRGVAHFYLEAFKGDSFASELILAKNFAKKVCDCYGGLIGEAYADQSSGRPQDCQTQLDYHTLYLLQVLTMDRGSIVGLLAHSDNDLGIMGSLPRRVRRSLLTAWMERMPEPMQGLLASILGVLPQEAIITVDNPIKQKLADCVRSFHSAYPEAPQKFLAPLPAISLAGS